VRSVGASWLWCCGRNGVDGSWPGRRIVRHVGIDTYHLDVALRCVHLTR
jgi:hypothetical protein